MTAATVYNLSELATVLSADGQHPDLVEAIERAAAVSSAHRDLREALLGLNLLRRLTHAGDETPLSDDDMTTIVGSLMTNAIILYARATDTKPIARRKWFGEGKLPTDVRAVHRELLSLAILVSALGDCIPDARCDHDIEWQLILGALAIALVIGTVVRLLINQFAKRRGEDR